MNAAQAAALLILVSQGVVAFLLSQSDVAVEGLWKVALGAASVALNVIALYLKVSLPGRDSSS